MPSTMHKTPASFLLELDVTSSLNLKLLFCHLGSAHLLPKESMQRHNSNSGAAFCLLLPHEEELGSCLFMKGKETISHLSL